MTWKSYNLDQKAQKLVLLYRDKKGVIGQSHKMRTTVPYGLERFWGEHLRLIDKNDATDQQKGRYWRDVWQKFVDILEDAGLRVPRGKINPQDKLEAQTKAIQAIAREFWNQETFPLEDQRIALYVLTQLCDSLVFMLQNNNHFD